MELKLGNINLDRIKLHNIYNSYLGMSPREQTIALVGAIVVGLLIIILPVIVASGKISKLERSVDDGNKKLKQITREINELNTSKMRFEKIEKELVGGFDSAISTTLESLAANNGISDRIDSLKEKPVASSDLFDETSVDVRLKKVGLPELVDYLYAIEHNPNKILRIKRLEIKPRYDNVKEFNVSFQVSTYRLLESGSLGE